MNSSEREREPTFDSVSVQERARSRRVALVLGVMLGPSLRLGLAGFIDAAGIALVVGIACAFLLVVIISQADAMVANFPGLSGGLDLWLAALVVLLQLSI